LICAGGLRIFGTKGIFLEIFVNYASFVVRRMINIAKDTSTSLDLF
jgi:hypothetical protein